MIDAMTERRLEVSDGGQAGPYIMLPLSQLEEVERLLTRHGVFHRTGDIAVTIDGDPETVVIALGRGGNAAAVQRILDAAA